MKISPFIEVTLGFTFWLLLNSKEEGIKLRVVILIMNQYDK